MKGILDCDLDGADRFGLFVLPDRSGLFIGGMQMVN
jgi:hypothetical protein